MKKTNHGKSAIIFVSGLLIGLSALLVANAYTITTNIDNAVSYLKKMVFMNNAWNSTGVIIDGNGPSYFSGNVGIGITSPTEKLDVSGTGKFTNVLVNGNIGLGTTSPIAKLDVNQGNISIHSGKLIVTGLDESYVNINPASIAFNRNAPTYLINLNTGSSAAIQFYVGNTNTPMMYITSGGNIGIGTSTPAAKLDVNGSIKIGVDASATCTAAGTIKFSGDSFYACTGTSIPRAKVTLQ